MSTERYNASIFGIDSNYYTNEYVAYLWADCAENEYKNSGIFVSAVVEINSLVCGKILGCESVETAHIVRTIRNHEEYEDEEKYKTSFLRILYEVRQKLGNPNVIITIDKTNFIQFGQL